MSKPQWPFSAACLVWSKYVSSQWPPLDFSYSNHVAKLPHWKVSLAFWQAKKNFMLAAQRRRPQSHHWWTDGRSSAFWSFPILRRRYHQNFYDSNSKHSEKAKLHPGRLTWNLQITHLERKMIFQTSMLMFHVNLQGCKPTRHHINSGLLNLQDLWSFPEGQGSNPLPEPSIFKQGDGRSGVMILPTQTMHYYKGNPSTITNICIVWYLQMGNLMTPADPKLQSWHVKLEKPFHSASI